VHVYKFRSALLPFATVIYRDCTHSLEHISSTSSTYGTPSPCHSWRGSVEAGLRLRLVCCEGFCLERGDAVVLMCGAALLPCPPASRLFGRWLLLPRVTSRTSGRAIQGQNSCQSQHKSVSHVRCLWRITHKHLRTNTSKEQNPNASIDGFELVKGLPTPARFPKAQ